MDLNNILVKDKSENIAYQIFYKISQDSDYLRHLRHFGEVRFVLKRGNKIKSKISDCGKKPIMVGYVRNSTRDTYRMLNLDTQRVTNTRDIKWTNKV